MSEATTARTYNQNHAPRKYAKGRRRVSVYISWSYPGGGQPRPDRARQPLLDDDRGAARALARLRGAAVGRPAAVPAGDRRARSSCSSGPGCRSRRRRGGHRLRRPDVPARRPGGLRAAARRAGAGRRRHAVRVRPGPQGHRAGGRARRRSRRCARSSRAKGPASSSARTTTSGASTTWRSATMEYRHHGDALVPRQQRFGGYTRALMQGLGIPVENRYGLRPAVSRRGRRIAIAPLTIAARPRRARLADGRAQLQLPHAPAALRGDDATTRAPFTCWRASRSICRGRIRSPNAGNKEFNTLVWMPPEGDRAGDVLVVDSTVFSTLFGGDESLERFWKNIADGRIATDARAGRHPERRPAAPARRPTPRPTSCSASTTRAPGAS